MNTIVIALRNMNRQKRRTLLLSGAIAFGIAVIVLLNTFTAGLVENVQGNFSYYFAGHIYLNGMEKTASGQVLRLIADDTVLEETIAELGLGRSGLIRRSGFTGSLIFGGKTVMQQVKGVDWQAEKALLQRLQITAGSLDRVTEPESLVLSQATARELGIEVGETLLVKLQTVTGQQNVGEFRLVAITAEPGFLGSLSAYANLETVNRLLNIGPEEYQSLSIFLEDVSVLDVTAARLKAALSQKIEVVTPDQSEQEIGPSHFARLFFPGSYDTDWEGTRIELLTLNDVISEALELVVVLDAVGLVVLLILLIIIMIGIVNTFRMVLVERVREIGTMRALGVQRGSIRLIFLLEAFFLALAGILAGLVLALLISLGLSQIDFDVNSPFFLFMRNGHPYFKIVFEQLALNFLLVTGLTLLAALLPASRAARLHPAAALRKHY
jgi:putative ABC transport system permease protein